MGVPQRNSRAVCVMSVECASLAPDDPTSCSPGLAAAPPNIAPVYRLKRCGLKCLDLKTHQMAAKNISHIEQPYLHELTILVESPEKDLPTCPKHSRSQPGVTFP